MSILFKKLRYKNFLSTGNAGVEIDFLRHPTTLVQGASGSGKSTMIDALCFALYGKPFRSISRPGLINSVNGKQCAVEVELSTNGREYRIVRGMKPTKFEIYCDGVLINQEAALRDYQQVLEAQVLNMSFKTFTQIVILGSTAYTPFMQLAAGARREVIEDILDIGIFSTMNQLLKARQQETKDGITAIDAKIATSKERAEGLKRLIDTLSRKRGDEITALQEEIGDTQAQISEGEATHQATVNRIAELKSSVADVKRLVNEQTEGAKQLAVLQERAKEAEQRVEWFETQHVCTTCEQAITEQHRDACIEQHHRNQSGAQAKILELQAEQDARKVKLQEARDVVKQIEALTAENAKLDAKLTLLRTTHQNLVFKLAELSAESGDVNGPKEELRAVVQDVVSLVERKKGLFLQKQLQENAAMLLRDTGIKTAIIREYLPLINRYLNYYLNELQMDVEFTLDESFNESVKSRYRDEFTYGNFSEGEKLRIDLAIMFSWRQLAKAKNSASCNLLILDEVLVGRLDPTNTEIVINMIEQMGYAGTNIFAIAHGDNVPGNFRGQMRFEKQGNFSVMV